MSATDAEQSRNRNSKFKQKFKQQRLPAWQPILTADTVLPAFFLIGLLFIPLGVALYYFSESVNELQYDYTDCESKSHQAVDGGALMCKDVIDAIKFEHGKETCKCSEKIELKEDFKKNVYMYYGLNNFYQNHRRYVKSRDDRQLLGKEIKSVSQDCEPFAFDKETGQIYAPCGTIANSMFNDTLTLYRVINSTGKREKVPLLNTNIAWDSDKKLKFNNPPGSLDAKGAFKNTTQPPYWTKPVYELDPNNSNNNGYENEDLIVWMRTAAFPNFRKLYRRVNHEVDGYIYTLEKGLYILEVDYNYPVSSFDGRKRMILSTTSFLGGKNTFLGVAYMTVGVICIILGIVFLIIHIKYGRRASEHMNVTPTTPFQE